MSDPNANVYGPTDPTGPSGSVSRRDFIGSAALTSAGVAAGLSAYFSRPVEETTAETEKTHRDHVRMGFIGLGNRGGSLLRTALQVPGSLPIALCDKQATKLEDGKKRINDILFKRGKDGVKVEVSAFDDYRRLLDQKDVEAVVIATPHYLHGPMAIDAIQAGKHVYCEKALAFTIGENQDILRLVEGGTKAADGRPLVFQVGHQRHYSPLYQRVKHMIASDHIGDVCGIRGQWDLNEDSRRPCDSLELERIINWRFYQEYSGGLTTEYATHQIDVANWFLGEGLNGVTHPDSVTGYGGVDWYHDGRDTHDNIHLVFCYRVPVVKRDDFGRPETVVDPATKLPKLVHEKEADGSTRLRNVYFEYHSTMANAYLKQSELVQGRYGTIEVSLNGGEFFKEKKAREDVYRIAEGTNPRRARQKSILRSGATVDAAANSLVRGSGDPIEEEPLGTGHWTRFVKPIEGAYDKVETLLAMESYLKCIRRARSTSAANGEPFAEELKANVTVGMYSAVPALMANIAMREQRTVRWSEFFNGAV
jgi:predicted dehydrogenase